MSIDHVKWALQEAPINDPIEQLVLIALAETASRDGTGAYPSVSTIAKWVRCSTRTVHTKLRSLEKAGLISRGDQSEVEQYPAHRRPVVYNVKEGVNGTSWGEAPRLYGVKGGVKMG